MIISFILVEPAVPENIGAAARAIKTMGFSRLLLVNPCNYLCDKSKMLAHGSIDILEKAKVFSSLNEAVNEIDFVIGTTARKRTIKYDYHLCSSLPEIILGKADILNKVAIVFGREEFGLKNDEVKLCHIMSSIDLYNKYPSLNLSQSVMLYAYTLSQFNFKKSPLTEVVKPLNQLKALKNRVSTILQFTGLGCDTLIYGRIMERLMLLGTDDINLLHSITRNLIEHFKAHET